MPAIFTLDTSQLAANRYKTVAKDADVLASFRDLQIHLTQAGASQDMEVHYLELHLTLTGVSKEDL